MPTQRKRPLSNAHQHTMKRSQHAHTFRAIQKWHQAMFEKLGWMLLARDHGYHEKIVAYKAGLNHLCSAIEYKIKHTREADRKEDLKILLHNTHILMDHVSKDFP